MALTAWQLYQMKKMLANPGQLCKSMQSIPPFKNQGGCPGWAIKLGGQAPPPPPPPTALADLVPGPLVLASFAVLAAGGGALWLWQRKMANVNYENARCPASAWKR